MIKATTSTGAIYYLPSEGRRLYKVKNGRIVGGYYDSIWSMKYSTLVAGEEGFNLPWHSPEVWKDGLPVVGKHFYVATRNEWWVTTPIVSVEEVDESEIDRFRRS